MSEIYDPNDVSISFDDPANPTGRFDSHARHAAGQLAAARDVDPLKKEISMRTQRAGDISRQGHALKQLEDAFHANEGKGFFAADETGKPMKGPDGGYIPDMGARIDALRAKAGGKVGFLRGALTPAVAGDPTEDATKAQQELSLTEPRYKALQQKWNRIQEQRTRWQGAHDENEMQLGSLSAQRMARDGQMFGAPQESPPPGFQEAAPPVAEGVASEQAPPVDSAAATENVAPGTSVGGSLSERAQKPYVSEGPSASVGDYASQFASNAADQGIALAKGFTGLAKMAGDIYGITTGNMGNALSKGAQAGTDFLESIESDDIKGRRAAVQANVASQGGEVDKALAWVKGTFSDPALLSQTMLEQLPNLIGTGGIGAVSRVAAEKVLMRKIATDAAKEIALKKTTKIGVGAGIAAGAVMQGGDIGSDTNAAALVELERKTVPQLREIPEIAKMIDAGESPSTAKLAYALSLGRKAAAKAAAISVGAQFIPGAQTIEKAVIGGAAKVGAKGIGGAVAGALGEGISETVEEVGGALAKNLGVAQVNPDQSLTQDLGVTAAQAFVTSAGIGGIAGAGHGPHATEHPLKDPIDLASQVPPAAPGAQPPGQPNQPPPAPSAGPAAAQPPPAGPTAPTAANSATVPPAAPAEEATPVDAELQAELDAQQSAAAQPPVVAKKETTAPQSPVNGSATGPKTLTADSVATPAAEADKAPESGNPSVAPIAPTPASIDTPENRAAWMKDPNPTDPVRLEQIKEAFDKPEVSLRYSIYDGEPGRPRAHQVDAIDSSKPEDEQNTYSSNVFDLNAVGVKAPVPPADLKPGQYTGEQIQAEIDKRAGGAAPAAETDPRSSELPGSDVIQSETPAVEPVEEKKNTYDKSSTQVTLKEADAAPIKEFAAAIPDEDIYTEEGDRTFGRETQPHITALYGINNDEVAPVTEALSKIGPITVQLEDVSSFENTDKPYDVLKVGIDSPQMRAVNAAIKAATDNSSDFPDYKPHLTLAYVKKGTAKKYVGDARFKGKTLTFDTLQFRTRDGRSIDIPLGGSGTGSASAQSNATEKPGTGKVDGKAGNSARIPNGTTESPATAPVPSAKGETGAAPVGTTSGGSSVRDMTPIAIQEIEHATGDIFEVDKPVSEAIADAERGVERYTRLLDCLHR